MSIHGVLVHYIRTACLSMLLVISANVSATQSLTLVAEDDWFPFTGLIEGRIEGWGVDILRAAYAAVGIDVQFKSMPFARCLALVEAGTELGCFNTARETAGESIFLFHKIPLYENKTGVFAMPSSLSVETIKLKDLIGQTVGYTNGYTYGDYLMLTPGIHRSVAPNDLANLRMLVAGRHKFSLIGTLNAGYLFKTHPEYFKMRPKLVAMDEKQGMYVSFSRKRADATWAADALDAGLALILKNGTYKKIELEWKSRYPLDVVPISVKRN